MCAIVFGCTSIWLNVNQLRYLPKLKLKRKQKLILDVHFEYIERMAIVPEQQFRELDRIQAVKLNPEAAERERFFSHFRVTTIYLSKSRSFRVFLRLWEFAFVIFIHFIFEHTLFCLKNWKFESKNRATF